MSAARATVDVDVDGRRLGLSNLEKVLYPAVGFTKGQVIDYYTRIAPFLLPHLAGRPLTLKRYPNGVEGSFFYEKNCPKHRPDWVRTVALESRRSDRVTEHCVVDDLPTLVWCANLASLELHTSMARAERIGRPTMVVFDLDPGEGTTIADCCDVALWLRELFEKLELVGFPKTSGSKGLQLYVPLNSEVGHEQTKAFALALAELLERAHPDRVVSRMAKKERVGRVFVDWSQNDQIKTTVCVYSLRARERPLVSCPVRWEEVEAVSERRDPAMLEFDATAVLDRVAGEGDLFGGVLDRRQELPALGDPEYARRRAGRDRFGR